MPLLLLFATLLQAATSIYSPLALYNGTWKVVAQHPFSGVAGTTDTLENACTLSAAAYTCDQTVNGKHAATVLFTAISGEANTFLITSVLPDGSRFASTRLRINGRTWIYESSTPPTAGQLTYRTVNTFQDDDHIHFVQSQSSDAGRTWTDTNAGDETRVAAR